MIAKELEDYKSDLKKHEIKTLIVSFITILSGAAMIIEGLNKKINANIATGLAISCALTKVVAD